MTTDPRAKASHSVPPARRARVPVIIAISLLAGTVIAGAGRSVWPGAGGADPLTPPPMEMSRQGRIHFGAQVDRTRVLHGSDGTVRMELVMGADASDEAPVSVPTDLVVAFDRSSSMSGQKLQDAKAALRDLLQELGPRDRFALISYSDQARLDVPLTSQNAAARAEWQAIVAGLEADGSTAISDALDQAMTLVESMRQGGRQPRVILISDGEATAGDTSTDGLLARAKRAARGEYVLSTVGVGEDFNRDLMTRLADQGTGNYYYAATGKPMGEIFSAEFASARETVAQGLAVRVPIPAGADVTDAAGYPLEHEGTTALFRPGALFAGQERRVWVTLRMPTTGEASIELAAPTLSYTQAGARRVLSAEALPAIACVRDERDFVAGIDKAHWERSIVQEEYGSLRQQVAEMVERGEQAPAAKAIEDYRQRNAELNRGVGSATVTQNLKDLDQLEAAVDDAFEGDGQADKQKKLGKEQSLFGWDGRRAGAKK